MFWNDRPRFARHIHNDDHRHDPPTDQSAASAVWLTYDKPSGAPFQTAEEAAGTWSGFEGTLFYGVRDLWLQEWAGILGYDSVSDLPISLTEANRVLNDWAAEYKKENGSYPDDYLTVRGDGELWTRAYRRANNSDAMPSVFQVITEQGPVIFRNEPTDIEPVPITREEFQGPASSDSRYDVGFDANESQRDPIRRAPPTVDASLFARLTSANTQKPAGRSIKFDREQINENFHDRWGKVLWEDAPAGLADEFIRSATAQFSAGKTPNAERWLSDRMKSTSKYGTMYGRMEPGYTELEWQDRFRTDQFGLRVDDQRAQAIRGMSSGAAPASFQQSVEQSRDVQAVGQGRFSQRFANHIAQLGSLQKA